MNNIAIISAILLSLAAVSIRADLLDCEENKFHSLSDIPGIGPKAASNEDNSGDHQVRDWFKSVGCQIKKGASKVKEQAKKLGSELKDGAKRLGEKAKDLGADFQTKFTDFKDKLSKDSSEERPMRKFLDNVEIINPDLLKAEQQCGHGHILDALGNCSKLRK